jgi:hypothetical protein
MARFNVGFEITLYDFLRTDGFGDGCELITTVGLRFKSEAISLLEETFAEHGAHNTFAELYEPGSHHNNQRIRFVDRLGNAHHPQMDATKLDWMLQDLMTLGKLNRIIADAAIKFEKMLSNPEVKKRFKAEEVL